MRTGPALAAAAPSPPLGRERRLRERVEAQLRGFEVRALEAGATRRAAVALAIVDEGHGADLPGMPHHVEWSGAAALVLTKRSGALRRHAGQWALPGGRMDPGETAEQAALRELDEEVHLRLQAADVLGRLDDYVTRSGYTITPVVVWAGSGRRLRAEPAEVASVHRIALAELMRADAPLLERAHGSEHPVLRMPVGHGWIAAPTASVLYQFRELCIAGRPTRVAHFEQPAFAWR